MESTKKNLKEYNDIMKETDELYRNAAKAVGLSDCAFWILYSLRDSEIGLTQSSLSSFLYMPKQTVNSALKKLEENGYITLEAGTDRRSKYLSLTKKGEALATITTDRVVSAEIEALRMLTDEEQETLLSLFHKYTELLKNCMTRLNKTDRQIPTDKKGQNYENTII